LTKNQFSTILYILTGTVVFLFCSAIVLLNTGDMTTETAAFQNDIGQASTTNMSSETSVTESSATEAATETSAVEKNTSVKETTSEEETTELITENPTAFIDADFSAFINEDGDTVASRFITPAGYVRVTYPENTFASYIQNYSLKPHGSKLLLHDGSENKNQTWCAAVFSLPVTHKYIQCADVIMKLIGNYFYYEKGSDFFDLLTFRYYCGLVFPYTKFVDGYRHDLTGTPKLVLKKSYDASENNYLAYMSNVYCYANTYSLRAQSRKISLNFMYAGAYFIITAQESAAMGIPASYGHAVMVVDVAKNPDTGDIAFLLAQGDTPAEELHVFLNPLHPDDPWYYLSEMTEKTFSIPFRSFLTSGLYSYNTFFENEIYPN